MEAPHELVEAIRCKWCGKSAVAEKQRDELLAECKKQVQWLQHVMPQLSAHGRMVAPPFSVLMGFEQALKALSAAIAKASS